MVNRRQLIGGVAGAAVAYKWSAGKALSSARYPRARYDQAIVIDALGGLGEFNPDAPDEAPLSARALADARASGVTAINFTVNDVGNGPNKFMATVKNIANLEHEMQAHPDALMKILRGRDIQTAKATKRMGIIFGCQDTTMLEANLKNLAVFADLGVSIVQPTYNIRNLMATVASRRPTGA